MSKSMSELREQLSAIEPDEGTYRGIGAAEIGSLRDLLDDEEAWLAARAVHALSRIDTDDARAAVVSAAGSDRMEVRVAAASAAGLLPPAASNEVLTRLLSDSQPSVRKFAVKSISNRNSEAVRRAVRDMANTETDSWLRQTAEEKAASITAP